MAVLATVSQLNESLVEASAAEQLTYWGVRFTALLVALFGAHWLVEKVLHDRFSSPSWLKPVIVVSALAIAPFTIIELALESRLPMVPAYDDGEFMAISPLLAYAAEYATNASIVMPLHFLVWLLIDRRTESAKPTLDDTVTSPTFLNKTQGVQLGDVLALKADEHYVRIYTVQGTELIHQKFGDAIAELPESMGLRVHRSWWVADAHVAHARRGTRRWQLILSNDTEVPVSDAYTKAARDRGLFKRKARSVAPRRDTT